MHWSFSKNCFCQLLLIRIEDAFEVLTTINTSTNDDEIKMNLDTLYIIIAQLSGKALESVEEEVPSNDKKEVSINK